VRVLTTTDFVGTFFPQPTSYGRLPGGAALQATVDDLRTDAGAAAWVDTGDLAQGSALGALSDGVWPFLALRELSVDVSVVGNHELDWGVDHLHRWGAELPFPLLAANLDLGLPATRLLAVEERALGVIGLSVPALAALHPGASVDPDSAGLVARHAAALRRDGAERVVLALHDGVDPVPAAAGPPVAATGRIERLCDAVRGHVDLVLGGHTLMRFAGTLAGVPFLQPWAFGSEVGVADLEADGRVVLRLVDTGAPRPWGGAGAAAQAALEREVVGRLGAPLRQAAGRDTSLADAVAAGVLRREDRVDWACVAPGDLWNQPARDGVHAFLDAGDVSLAQVLRLTPFCGARSAWGGQLVVAELSRADAERIVQAADGAVARRTGGSGPLALALSPYVAATAGAGHDWHPLASTWRDGLLAAVS
jgi:hypothetical protein